MSTVTIKPFLLHCRRETPRVRVKTKVFKPCYLNCSAKCSSKLVFNGCNTSSFSSFKPQRLLAVRAGSSETTLVETSESSDVFFKHTFPLKRTETVEGKIFIRLDQAEGQHWQLTVGCSLPGKWILHWGVSYLDDMSSEWDQPPEDMRPLGSISIKDYAIETPLEKSSEGNLFHEVKINLNLNSSIAAINFVLKDEATGAWYQHKGRDFKVPLVDYLEDDGTMVGAKRGFSIWPGF